MSAFLKIFAAIAMLISLALGAHPLPPGAALPSQQGLARLFFASRVTAQDPSISMACFADYIAYSNQIGETYSANYNNCLVDATASRKVVDQEVLTERRGIEQTSEGVCRRIRTCNEYNSTLDMFNCHADMGSNNTKATYAISGNASEYATFLHERYRLIDLHHEQCCHSAERNYVDQTAGNYNHLQSCLDGRAKPRPPPTTEAPSTTTTSTTTTSTTTTTTQAPPAIEDDTTTENPGVQEQFAQLLNLLN